MAQSVLELILRSKKQGDAAKQVESDLGKMGKAADQSGRSFKVFDGISLAVGQKIFDIGQAALRAVPELVELGIQSDRARVALEAYAGGGDQAAEMLEAVTEASGGAIDKISAMQNATRLLSMGLASNADEAAKLTDIAVTLGATMGRGPQQAFEEFTLLLANQSILRLDTFGISGAKVKQRMEELAEATGETDRQTLFLTATMEEATKKLNALDQAGFKATNNLDRMKTTVADAKIGVGEWLADGLMPWIDGIFGVRDALDDQQESLVDNTESYEDFTGEMAQALSSAGPLALGFRLLTEDEYNLQKQTDTNTLSMESFDRAIQNAKTTQEELNTQMTGETKQAYEDAIQMLDNYNIYAGDRVEIEKEILRLTGELTPEEENRAAALNVLNVALQTGKIDRDTYLEWLEAIIEDGKTAADVVDAIKLAIQNVPTVKNVYIDIRYRVKNRPPGGLDISEPGPDAPVQYPDEELDPGLEPGGQYGLDMIVPPGYPNDTYRIRASSGERVTITPNYTNNFYLSASYAMQSEGSLRDDVRMLMQLYGRR